MATSRAWSSSGYLRVTVSAAEAKVEYGRLDRSLAHSDIIPAGSNP